MDERKVCLVRITGLKDSIFSRQQAIAAFAALLQISHDEAGSRIAGAPFTVRSGLAANDAAKYFKVLERMGFDCLVLEQGTCPSIEQQ
ncbi:MAG: hypothetical protein IT466_10475 [Moraxellaceae bacterium]|nr:hypothetical protein [Moraxellaceae bacterium]